MPCVVTMDLVFESKLLTVQEEIKLTQFADNFFSHCR